MKSLWNSREAARCKDKLDLLVYSSRLIGAEPKLCVWGGGNTSTKTLERDTLGRMRRVLRIKGSGSDLKVSTRRDYPPVALDDLLEAGKIEKMTDEEMVDFVSRSLLDPKAPRPSIEVLLHAFLDRADIHHTHADAILSITNTKNGKKIAKKIFGEELLWVPYVKPGFTLAKRVGEATRKNPKAKGVILEKHGLITWADDARTSYELTIEMITKAERYIKSKSNSSSSPRKLRHPEERERRRIPTRSFGLRPQDDAWHPLYFLPILRGAVSQNQKAVLHLTQTPEVLSFVNRPDCAHLSQIGPATPDHMLRTRRLPLFLKLTKLSKPMAKITPGVILRLAPLGRRIEEYARAHQRYYKKYKHLLPDGPYKKMFDPYPKVILIPGIGMITIGKDLGDAKIVAEIYQHSISVMTSAQAIDRYASLTEREAFEMDYWPMELYKLSLAPAEAEFSRHVGLVTGAARGIGRAIAERLATAGAHVFLADLKEEAVQAAAQEINKRVKSGRAFGVGMDVTRPASVSRVFEKIILTTGGLDFVVSNAGIAHVASLDTLKLEDWERSLAVNATGHFLVAQGAVRIMKRQNLGGLPRRQAGALVFIASKNVPAPGKDFGAYAAAKSAETQLARVLAIETGAEGIRVNIIHPDGIFEGSGLWDTIRETRAKSYGIKSGALEKFYQSRNLMQTPVLAEDVAEAAAFFLSKRSAKTTGCVLTVDGGLREAFPR